MKRKIRVRYVPRLWVVEMLNTVTGRWEATVEVGLWQYAARAECRIWHKHNPSDRFRVRRYAPATSSQRKR